MRGNSDIEIGETGLVCGTTGETGLVLGATGEADRGVDADGAVLENLMSMLLLSTCAHTCGRMSSPWLVMSV